MGFFGKHFIDEFEQAKADYCGWECGNVFSGWTTALQVAVDALKWNQAMVSFYLPAFTIISCALAIVHVSAHHVLVDCDPETCTMDVERVAAKITSRIHVIMFVHI